MSSGKVILSSPRMSVAASNNNSRDTTHISWPSENITRLFKCIHALALGRYGPGTFPEQKSVRGVEPDPQSMLSLPQIHSTPGKTQSHLDDRHPQSQLEMFSADHKHVTSKSTPHDEKPVSFTKSEWKQIAKDMDTDIVYSWRQCRKKYEKVFNARRKSILQQAKLLKLRKIAQQEQEQREREEAMARDAWHRDSRKRLREAELLDSRLIERFHLKIPLQVLEALERKPSGRPQALYKFVAEAWAVESWEESAMKQFGRTLLHGYQAVSFLNTNLHYDAGNKFDHFVYLLRAVLFKWNVSPSDPFKGPSLDEEEGYLMHKIASQCTQCSDTNIDLNTLAEHIDIPSAVDPSKSLGSASVLIRAQIELGEHHPVVAQLILMSLSVRLVLLQREAHVSSLRGSCGNVVRQSDHTSNASKFSSSSSHSPTAATIGELFKNTETLDPVRYSPSKRRYSQIRDLISDAELALHIARQSMLKDESDRSARKEIYAEALMVHSMVFAVAGAHWAISEFTRGYNTIDLMTNTVVAQAIKHASLSAKTRLEARYNRHAVRRQWEEENHRLYMLDVTSLRKERARLRQEYRRHKKRGRPGRIEMKKAKHKLEILQMDLDHAMGKTWHPKHNMSPPSTKTPRLGFSAPTEKLPPGWCKTKLGTSLKGFKSEDQAYYFNENTGKVSRSNPLNPMDVDETISMENITTTAKEESMILKEKNADEIMCQDVEHKIRPEIESIKQHTIIEQHRRYFSEAWKTAKESVGFMLEFKLTRSYRSELSFARVCFAAANVADSEGNLATGLNISGCDLINMAVDHMASAMHMAKQAGLAWTLEYACMCRESAKVCFYRKKDGDVSDGAEYLLEAQLIHSSLGFGLTNWHVIETKEMLDALVQFDGYSSYHNL